MSNRLQRHLKVRSRKGSIYLITVGASLLVSLLGMAAILKVQIRGQQSDEATAVIEARNCARCAAALALFHAQTDPNWRSKMASDTWVKNQPLGNGNLSFQASEIDGSLTDSIYDPVQITATGTSGSARQVLEVTLQPKRISLACIQVPLHVGGLLLFNDIQFTSNGLVSSNMDVAAADSVVDSNVEAAGQIVGTTFTQTTTSGAPTRSLPGGNVFDDYLAAGTSISYSSLPDGSSSNEKRIRKQLLSPNQNPWGAVNANGIYIIDCQGKQLVIRDSRIVATLVLLNVDEVEIKKSVSWEPPQPNYPTLLVSGNARFHMDKSPLDEDDEKRNFNPSGTPYPYPFGSSNSNSLDEMASEIRGLVYVTGQLNLYENTCVRGVMVCGGTCICADPSGGSANVSFTYDPTFANNPPPGFEDSVRVHLGPGTWKQIVD